MEFVTNINTVKIIAQFFQKRRCPYCNGMNVESTIFKTTKEDNLLSEAIFAQVEKSESERFVCVDCDKWFLDNSGNTPGSGGRNEVGIEVIDGNSTPSVSDAEKPQKS